MLHFASFVSFLQFFFAPHGEPWWAGAVWGNVIAIVPCGVLGALWIKLKLWPLNLIQGKLDKLHEKHDLLAARHEVLHDRHNDLHELISELNAKHDRLHQVITTNNTNTPS